MSHLNQIRRRQTPRMRAGSAGFTLVEILVALALVTGLTVMMFQAVSPWLNLRQKIETERRLEDVKSALETAYRVNAMEVENSATAELRFNFNSTLTIVAPSTITTVAGNRVCQANPNAVTALSTYITDDANRSLTDGTRSPMCLLISNRLQQTREGVTIFYHAVAVVAMGNDGRLGTGTTLAAGTGVLTIDPTSDDIGILVNGFNTQLELYKETRKRVERVADVYGAYFTARYLGNPARDYSIDYFAADAAPFDSDPSAAVLPTRGGWETVSVSLANLGLGQDEQASAYEDLPPAAPNDIEVANQKLSAPFLGGLDVQEPATKSGLALPPYTALLRTRMPGPAGTYLVRVVPGNY